MCKTKDSLIAWKASVCQVNSPSALVRVDWQHLLQHESFNQIRKTAGNEEVNKEMFHFEGSGQFHFLVPCCQVLIQKYLFARF